MGQDRAAADPFQPARLGPLVLRNRFVKAATFEGMADNGLASERLVGFHRSMAAGGVALTTVAYLAVSADGQGAPGEIVLNPAAVPGLATLANAVHDEGALVSGQIGHAGPVAAATGRRGLAPSRTFSPVAMRVTRAASEQDLEQVVQDFAAATTILRQAGFDAVEIHMGHGYLLSSFLSPALNRRNDRWGGTVENRARLPRAVAAAVREAAGPDMAVLAKLNMSDGHCSSVTVQDCIDVARLLEHDGCIDAIELTAGSSFSDPMYLMRGAAPVRELAAQFPNPTRAAVRLLGGRFLRTYPFEEGFLSEPARAVRAGVSLPLVLLGGINHLDTVHSAMRSGFEFVALGRALLHEPGIINRWRSGSTAPGGCTHCNQCMPTIYSGTRCTLVTP